MGINLKLWPIDSLHGTHGFSHTVLPTRHAWKLWEPARAIARPLPERHDISALTAGIVPDGFSKGEPMYGQCIVDAYGKPYTWTEAHRLADVLAQVDDAPATIAYLRALPADTMVILSWE